MSLFGELKRRNVFRVAIAYAVVTWLALQVADLLFPRIGLDDSAVTVMLVILAIGFVPALLFAWAFEITPEGLKRESEINRDASIAHHTAGKLDKLTMVFLALVVVIVLVDRFVPEADSFKQEVGTSDEIAVTALAQPLAASDPSTTPDGQPSVAVLPFANMSSDPDNEYFSDGISEELLNLLVRVEGLRVPSRTSSFAFKGKQMDIRDIAEQLAVDHILEGSVRKDGEQVRITAQLIDVKTDTHLWSNTYDRKLENIFAIQDEISREIIRELKIALDTSGLLSLDADRPTNDMEAYQDYLRGKHLFIQRGVGPLKASVAALQSAVTRDPQFAEAWAALSLTAATLSGWDRDNQEQTVRLAAEAGARALALDPDSAVAHTSIGVLKFNQMRWSESLAQLSKGAALSRDSNPKYFYGLVLQGAGYLREATEHLRAAEVADPAYSQLQFALGNNAVTRDNDQAARIHYQRAKDGGNVNGWGGLIGLELRNDQVEAAIKLYEGISTIIAANQGSAVPPVDNYTAIYAALRDPELRPAGIAAAREEEDFDALDYFNADDVVLEILQGWLSSNRLMASVKLTNDLWGPQYSGLRKTADYKQFLRDAGLVALWQERGWPDLCRPLGEDDFECD